MEARLPSSSKCLEARFMHISKSEYLRAIAVFPRACVDIILYNKSFEVLLLKRANEPAKGQWWFPGGRVYHGETRLQAAKRLISREIGVDGLAIHPTSFCEELFFDFEGVSLHDITHVCVSTLGESHVVRIDDEFVEYRWARIDELSQLSLHPFLTAAIDSCLYENLLTTAAQAA